MSRKFFEILQLTNIQMFMIIKYKIVVLNVVGSSPTCHPSEGSLLNRASLLIYRHLQARPPPFWGLSKATNIFKIGFKIQK